MIESNVVLVKGNPAGATSAEPFDIAGEIQSCDFEPPDGDTLETLDKHWQNY